MNQDLKDRLVEKIDEGEFGVADLPDFLNLFCELANESEDVRDEAEGVSLTFQVEPEGADEFWLKIEDGTFSWGAGTIGGADNTLRAKAADAAMIFTGEKDATAAYQSGALKIEGELPNAVKLRTYIEIVRDEIEG